jgi:hypothetical protein
MSSNLLTPRDELEELRVELGSQRAVARVLGKSQRQVWEWFARSTRIQPENARLINDVWAVCEAIKSRVGAVELEHVLEMRWPTLMYRCPVDLIRAGNTDFVLEAVAAGPPEEAAPSDDSEGDAAFVEQVRSELEVSIRARLEDVGQVHEDFLFLFDMDDDQVMTFAGTARRTLDQAPSAADWEAFIDSQWEGSVAAPERRWDPVTAPRITDLELADSSNGLELADLLLPGGAMASRRFASGRQ